MHPDKDHLVALFFLQFLVILTAARAVGWVGRKFFGQTQAVGEMVAGILLGPSLLGFLAPEFQRTLFPKTLALAEGAVIPHPSMTILYTVAQLGLALYMFVIGMEFDAGMFSGRKKSAGMVSGAGMLLPFALGAGASFLLHSPQDAPLFTPQVSPWNGALYLGAAMSITAFPTLARILHEKGAAKTRMGTLALAAGAADDAAAWALLAVVVGILNQDPKVAWLAIGGGALYVAFTLTLGRRLLAPLGRMAESRGLTPGLLGGVLLLVLGASALTEGIKLYAVFGAFILGTAMPRGALTEKLTGTLEPLISTFLLPVFFAYSGLNTQIGVLGTPWLWAVAGILLLLAMAGKGLGCLAAARLGGESWRDALGIGLMMNTRGLMELVILNIGLQKGIITKELFAMMVIMALVTTLMASPLYNLLFPGRQARLALPHTD